MARCTDSRKVLERQRRLERFAAVGILLSACALHAPRGEASLGSEMNA